ncbi:hypothetical protein NDU88_002539 [Pleurodeles waltl]|uniref:Uncharacterized protein n=1 Tax=Pleurodeles waltl TaxID=8319 RepID=A0AAV7LJ30_PLEWA|nr:hypothetical protein NDU88_002539 [Pleurodeles waltl]
MSDCLVLILHSVFLLVFCFFAILVYSFCPLFYAAAGHTVVGPKRPPSWLALRPTSVSSSQGAPPPPWPTCPAASRSYPVVGRGARHFRRSREPEPAALPVGGSVDAEISGGSASVAAYPHASRRLVLCWWSRPRCSERSHDSESSEVTSSGGRASHFRPRSDVPPEASSYPRPIVPRALYLAGEICCFPGLHVSQFREAAGRLPEARVAPAVAEI